jgi:hypothetical protein
MCESALLGEVAAAAPSSPSAASSMAPQSTSDEKKKHASLRSRVYAGWVYLTEDVLRATLRTMVVTSSVHAARHPWWYIIGITCLSLTLIGLGFFTNFAIVYDHKEIFTPMGSLPALHADWIASDASGFTPTRPLVVMIHHLGDNVLEDAIDTMRHLFTVLETITATKGFTDVCSSWDVLEDGGCKLSSATQFWNHQRDDLDADLASFETVQEQNEYVIAILSNTTFPDGTPVFTEAIIANHQHEENDDGEEVNDVRYRQRRSLMEDDDDDFDVTANEAAASNSNSNSTATATAPAPSLLTYAESFILQIEMPNRGTTSDELEERILSRLTNLRNQWHSGNQKIHLEYFTMYAYMLEFERAVFSDIPLVVIMMVLMVAFCSLVFWKLQDKPTLGLWSIATIGMSLLTGYGLVWICGVAFTNICMMVPFIVVGVGLDDTFIIAGSYFRIVVGQQTSDNDSATETDTPQTQEEVHEQLIQRIEQTMREVGLSISLTTITTTFAFALGCLSSIPAIQWLCIYGCVTIAVDFIYQITYFIAWLVIDELWTWNRTENQKKKKQQQVEQATASLENVSADAAAAEEERSTKVATTKTTPSNKPKDNDDDVTASNALPPAAAAPSSSTQQQNATERFMGWYADQLLRPTIKAFVVVAFAIYLGACIYSTTQLTQEFNVDDYVPHDSYVASFFSSFEEYSSLFRAIGVYFRDIDASDPVIQQEMHDYVNELAALPQIGAPPEFFWLRDFADMATSPDFATQAEQLGFGDLDNKTFAEQIDLALSIPIVQQVYGNDIVRNEQGDITASRCFLFLRQLDMHSIPDQIDFLMDQRDVSLRQPSNQERLASGYDGGLAMFTFDDLYFYFELYAISVQELIFTTISGVVAVSVVAWILIPHWSAVFFVLPMIIMLYFMLLGKYER